LSSFSSSLAVLPMSCEVMFIRSL